jgi:arylsulfatase A-like enzyme
MGYRTPNVDRIAKEGAMFTDWYGQQSCTVVERAFITGQSPIRTGLTKVGLPGADLGLMPEDPTIADLRRPLGYVSASSARTIYVAVRPCDPLRATCRSKAPSALTNTWGEISAANREFAHCRL